MRVSLIALITTVLVLTGSSVWAQDIGKPDVDESKAEDEKATPEDLEELVRGAQNDVEKILDDMSENMREIEKLLEGKDTGSSTQSRQKKVLDSLDKLIEQASKT